MTLSFRLQKSMDNEGMSQSELAKRVGVSQTTIQKLISGKSETSKNIFEIANCLGVDPTWLVYGDPSGSDSPLGDDMTLSDRLCSSIKDAGLTQYSLAKRSGISQSAVQKLTSGEAKRSKHLVTIASVLGVDPTWLSTGNTSGLVDDDTVMVGDDDVSIPFFQEVKLSTGYGEKKTIQLSHNRRLSLSKRSLKKVGVKPQNVAYVKVSGNSMNPVMSDGSIVIIDTDNNVIVDGDIYVINQHNNLRVKIIYRIPRGGLRLRSFNSTEWPDEFYDKIDDIVILGRVFWYSSFI